MKRWLVLVLAGLVLAAVGGAGYLGAQSVAEPQATVFAIPQTVEVTRGNVQQTVTAPGELVQTGQSVLSFDVPGKLDAIDLRPGDRASPGAGCEAGLGRRTVHLLGSGALLLLPSGWSDGTHGKPGLDRAGTGFKRPSFGPIILEAMPPAAFRFPGGRNPRTIPGVEKTRRGGGPWLTGTC